jgi:hypothetical protein
MMRHSRSEPIRRSAALSYSARWAWEVDRESLRGRLSRAARRRPHSPRLCRRSRPSTEERTLPGVKPRVAAARYRRPGTVSTRHTLFRTLARGLEHEVDGESEQLCSFELLARVLAPHVPRGLQSTARSPPRNDRVAENRPIGRSWFHFHKTRSAGREEAAEARRQLQSRSLLEQPEGVQLTHLLFGALARYFGICRCDPSRAHRGRCPPRTARLSWVMCPPASR